METPEENIFIREVEKMIEELKESSEFSKSQYEQNGEEYLLGNIDDAEISVLRRIIERMQKLSHKNRYEVAEEVLEEFIDVKSNYGLSRVLEWLEEKKLSTNK